MDHTVSGMFTINQHVVYALTTLALCDGQSHFDRAKFYKISWDASNSYTLYFYDSDYNFIGDLTVDREGNIPYCNELRD